MRISCLCLNRRHFAYSWCTCIGTSVPFSLLVLLCALSSWDIWPHLTIDPADQRQVHHLLKRGKHWLWEQLRSENKTIQQIVRRIGDFHREVRDLAINNLFLVIKSRLRGEFLAGFLREAKDIILGTPPTSPRASSSSSSSTSSSSTSTCSNDG